SASTVCVCLPHLTTSSLLSLAFSSSAPPPTAIDPLSLHDALPILIVSIVAVVVLVLGTLGITGFVSPGFFLSDDKERKNPGETKDRKSTRLNSSHVKISYAVFCLKKKKR